MHFLIFMRQVDCNTDELSSLVIDSKDAGVLRIDPGQNGYVELSLRKEGLNYYFVKIKIDNMAYSLSGDYDSTNEEGAKKFLANAQELIRRGCSLKIDSRYGLCALNDVAD